MNAPAEVRGFVVHGFRPTAKTGDGTRVYGVCPFCGKDKKFYVSLKAKHWHCYAEGLEGVGLFSFLKAISARNQKLFAGAAAEKLATQRGLSIRALRAVEIGYDGAFYTIPEHIGDEVVNLKRSRIGGKLLSTAGGRAGWVVVDDNNPTVLIAEGAWDAAALFDIIGRGEGKRSILGASSANSIPTQTLTDFAGRTVLILFDNDDAGNRGARRLAEMLRGVARTVKVLVWPKGTADGFDLRDLYNDKGREAWAYLEKHLQIVTDAVGAKLAPDDITAAEPEKLTARAYDRESIYKAYARWLLLPNTDVIDVIFGATIANRLPGDPFWLFLVGPPGSAKTELLRSFTGSPLIETVTTLTPPALISGAQMMGGRDPSLIPKLDGKVLIVKDFTTILSMHPTARDEIFGILRDAYDGRIEKRLGNGVHRVYESSFGVIGGVTHIIETFNQSAAIGERFLRYNLRYPGRINVAQRSIEKALANVTHEDKMREDLQAAARSVLEVDYAALPIPQIDDAMKYRLMRLAQWTSIMRGAVSREKYSGEVQYTPAPEVGTRLAKQLATLMLGIALFRGVDNVDAEIYKIVLRVAMDTTPDRQEKMVRQMFLHQSEECTTATLSGWTGFPSATIDKVMQDLALLGIVKKNRGAYTGGTWELRAAFVKLMNDLDVYSLERKWRKKDAVH